MDNKLKRKYTQEVPNRNTFDKDLKLKRTDTQTVPNGKCYINESKYDKPQKKIKKTSLDSEDEHPSIYKRWETDSIIMPPPEPKSPPVIYNIPSVNPCKGSPHPKKLKKTHPKKLKKTHTTN